MSARLAVAILACAVTGATAEEAELPAWSFSASVYGYDVPDSEDYVNPSVTADRGALHLEARYNYESIDTTSLWIGANFGGGTTWTLEATLMIGGVFGELEGIAPGYRLAIARGWFELSSEGEYFASAQDQADSYFYTWTEVAGYPAEWFRAGLAAQRTRAYASELDIQRGVFVGFTYRRFDAAAYVFNPDEDPTWVLALRFDY